MRQFQACLALYDCLGLHQCLELISTYQPQYQSQN
ncbi:hypothetical protein [Acinetobacter phage Ab69]|nr:hypothetical protein [Acinetobacter phage Ab69]